MSTDISGNQVDRAIVSQGTRAMAQNKPDALIAELRRERIELGSELSGIAVSLREFSDAAMIKAQASVRRSNVHRTTQQSIEAWADAKIRMMREREKLIDRKLKIELRLTDLNTIIHDRSSKNSDSVKPLLHEEMKAQSGLLREILQRQIETNILLKRLIDK